MNQFPSLREMESGTGMERGLPGGGDARRNNKPLADAQCYLEECENLRDGVSRWLYAGRW